MTPGSPGAGPFSGERAFEQPTVSDGRRSPDEGDPAARSERDDRSTLDLAVLEPLGHLVYLAEGVATGP